MDKIKVASPAFSQGGWIPVEYTARGADHSPELRLEGLREDAVSLAVTLDDDSHPLFPKYNHWILWNVPVHNLIPAGLPAGRDIPGLPGAVQGIAYGRNRYKGPKPPLRAVHDYTFTVYALDRLLDLPPNSRRKDLFAAMEGHVLQQGTLTGKFQSHRKNSE